MDLGQFLAVFLGYFVGKLLYECGKYLLKRK